MATLIDVRELPEFAAGHIAGSTHVPLGKLAAASVDWDREQPVTLICKSGRRAEQARGILARTGFQSVLVLDGGVDAWTAAGKPLHVVARGPWALERQVRIAAGSLVLVTIALAYFVSRYFLLATTFVGAGLVFAGVSDTCMMGMLLAKLPWNQRRD